jgi:Dyp-type peroxidase family
VQPSPAAKTNIPALLREYDQEDTTAHAALENRRQYRAAMRDQGKRYPEKTQPMVLSGIGISAQGLLALTPGAADVPGEAFQAGLAKRSALLGDPTDPGAEGNPKQWVVGGDDAELDALITLAGDRREDVTARADELVKRLAGAGIEVPYREDGDILPGELAGHEHFGFDDGISQPGIRGRASAQPDDFVTERHILPGQLPESWLYAKPGQDLVWPGEFILGYPRTSPDPRYPGPNRPATPSWTMNGSFLVFRRLKQDVGLFWRTMRERAQALRAQPGFETLTDDELAAKLVGRWPSGAPVNRVPGGDVPDLGRDHLANNNIRYDSAGQALPLVGGHVDAHPMAKPDPVGATCPWAAHIRKVNTRDSGSDMGGRSATYERRILRSAIPFGPALADRYAEPAGDPAAGNRGLLFLCTQASIDDQFEFLTGRWMNDHDRPKAPAGHDMLIGQNGTPGENRVRRCTLFGKQLQQAELSTDKEWVIPTGGGYFFLPSVSALRDVLGD